MSNKNKVIFIKLVTLRGYDYIEYYNMGFKSPR
jgi:hypothetical protein